MSFRPLVEGECGGNNSLVQLSSIFSRDGTTHAGTSQADLFVDEYFVQNQTPHQQTFQMNSLLSSLRDIQQHPQHPQASQSQAHEEQWTSEFSQMPKQTVSMGHNVWNAPSFAPPQMPMIMPHSLPFHPTLNHTAAPALEYVDEDQYNATFQNQEDSMVQDSQKEIREKAKDLVEAVVDQNVAYSQFISFMKKVGGGEMSLEMPGEMSFEMPGDSNMEHSVETKPLYEQTDMLKNMEEKYKDEWAKLSDMTDVPWTSQFDQKTNPFTEYSFSQENNMADNPNALEIGKQKLKLGDVPGAVLCFEASVKQDASLVEGWLLLGTTQAENEQDPQAIAALTECVRLDPTCLAAYLALGSSYTNESYPHLAYRAFNNWLKANPKYSDLVPLDMDIGNMNNLQLQDHIQSNFIRAARMNPEKIDPDIQCALGVLFNISQEYNKAIDCFKAALMVRADDSRLWNKLGATLANGERSEEAVDAYYQALNLEPGFIRARYNVGITCMNLEAHKEAAEHFLIALNQQVKAQGMTPSVSQGDTSSSTIWSTLRMVCAFMGKHDITPLIDSRDLNQLNKHFGME